MLGFLMSSGMSDFALLGTIALWGLGFVNHLGVAQARDNVQVEVYQNPPKVLIDEQGEAAGFCPELLNEVAAEEDWQLQYIPCEWEQCLKDLEAGNLDLMVDVAYSPQREKRFDFNEEVVFVPRSFFYTTTELDLTSIAQLDQKPVAVLKGSIQADKLRNDAQRLNIQPQSVAVNDYPTLFQKLNTGEAEVEIEKSPSSISPQLLMKIIAIISSLSALGTITIILLANQRLKQELIKRQDGETALRHSEQKFRTLIGNIPGAIFRYVQYADGSNRIPYMSPVCEKLWEFKASDVEESAELMWKTVHPDDVLPMRESVMLSATTLQPWFYEWRIITPSGRIKWLQGRGNPQEKNNGTVVWDAVVYEVTAQKLVEEALEESEQKLRLTNAVPGAVYQYQIDKTGKEHFLFISEGIKKLYGFSPKQVMAQPQLMWDVLDERTQLRLKFFRDYSMTTLSPWECEYEINLPSGEKKWIKGEAIPQKVEDGTIWKGILVDISQQKWQEQLLATQQEILEDLAEGEGLNTIVTQLIYLVEQKTKNLTGSVWLLEKYQFWLSHQSPIPPEDFKQLAQLHLNELAELDHDSFLFTNLENLCSQDVNQREIAKKYQIKVFFSVPILSSKGTVLGLFSLHGNTARSPDHYERQLLDVATKLVSLAIERKQQEEILQKQAQQEQLLSKITVQIRQSLNLQTVLA